MHVHSFVHVHVHVHVEYAHAHDLNLVGSAEGVAAGNQEMANLLALNTNSLKQIYLSTAGKGLNERS